MDKAVCRRDPQFSDRMGRPLNRSQTGSDARLPNRAPHSQPCDRCASQLPRRNGGVERRSDRVWCSTSICSAATEAARHHNNSSDRRDHVNGESNTPDDRSSHGGWSSQWGPMTPFIEQWSMAMRAWADAWSAFVPGHAGRRPGRRRPSQRGQAAPRFIATLASATPPRVGGGHARRSPHGGHRERSRAVNRWTGGGLLRPGAHRTRFSITRADGDTSR